MTRRRSTVSRGRRALHAALLVASFVLVPSLTAQTLTVIGKTSAGSPVSLDTKSARSANGITTATFRVALAPSIKTSSGDMVSMRSVTMIDCAKQTTATKERWFYFDEKQTRVARHDVPKIPGYGPALKGSLADVVIAHICAAKK